MYINKNVVKPKFESLTITIETMDELKTLISYLGKTGNNEDAKVYGNTGARFLEQLYDQLDDIKRERV